LRGGGADIDRGMKEDLDDADAGQRLALDMVDIGHRRGKLAFVIIDHPAGHIVGRESAIGPHSRYDGNLDVGKYVGRRLHHRQTAEQDDQNRQHDEGVGASQRQADNSDHGQSVSLESKKTGAARRVRASARGARRHG